MPRGTDRDKPILDHISRWPGTNLRQTHRATEIPLSTTARILERLVRQGQVRIEARAGYSHYYPAQGLHKRERVLLATLAKPRPRALLSTIHENPGIQHKDLAVAVGIPPPTATYYLKQLVAKDLVTVRKKGIERHYRIKNPDMLEKAFKRTKAWDEKVA